MTAVRTALIQPYIFYSANIVVKSDRKMASKNSFQSCDGQSTKMGEKTQQVLRLIAALISSYLFCWETDIFGDTDISAVDDGLMQTLVPNLSPTSISAHNFHHMNFGKLKGFLRSL